MKPAFLFVLLLLSISAIAQDSPVVTDTSEYEENFADTAVFDILDYDDEEDKDFAGPSDSTNVKANSFSEDDVERLKADPDLNYEQPPTIAESLWDRFLRWIGWFFQSLFENATTTGFGRMLMYLLAGAIVVVIIMMLLKVDAFKVFYAGADQGKQGYKVFDENIHEMNFEKLIQEAIDKKEFRLATRLVFLHALKLLSDKHLIEFNPGKTNHDYVEELEKGELKTGLNELSFYFDYAWYGNFTVSETQFQKIKGTFSEWREKIGTRG